MKTFVTSAILAVILLGAAATRAQWASDGAQIPAYHKTPPTKDATIPPVLTEKQLSDQGLTAPVQIAAYKAAAKAPDVMYQQPCYCYCDRGHGHTSLHSCFESTHGANCGTCMAEALYSYQMAKKGWDAKAIREGILRGDWKMIDLQHPAPVN